jgi:hypothetical protein
MPHVQRARYRYEPYPRGALFRYNIDLISKSKKSDSFDIYADGLKRMRAGIPTELSFDILEEEKDSFLVQTCCIPSMYTKIAQSIEFEFVKQNIEDAEVQCRAFTREAFIRVLGGTEIEIPSTQPFISRPEVRSRLMSMGQNSIVSKLDEAEQRLVRGDESAVIMNSRTVLEMVIELYLKSKSLEKTDGFKNNVERLVKRQYLAEHYTSLLYGQLYSPMSEIIHGRMTLMRGDAKLFLNLTIAVTGYLVENL